MTHDPLRVVLLTNSSPHGQRVLLALARRGVRPDVVLVLSPPWTRAGEHPLRRLAAFPLRVARRLRRAIRYRMLERRAYLGHAAGARLTGAMNSRRLLRDLRAASPDLLLLGGGGIVGREVIATARLGVLNAHPALLPWLRGNGVVGRGLEVGIAPGATVHCVEAGIDTGPIVARRLFIPPERGMPLEALELGCARLAAELMAEVVEAAVRGGRMPESVPQADRHPLNRADPPRRAEQDRLARGGRAAELYDRWRPLGEPDSGTLPAGDLEPPAG